MKDEDKKKLKKVTITVMIFSLGLFAVILLFTGILGHFFGKTAENIGLIIIAIVLAIMYFLTKRG